MPPKRKADGGPYISDLKSPARKGARQSTRIQNLTTLLEEKEKQRKSAAEIAEFSEDAKAISQILQEDGMVRKYPFPQTWESDLELEYKDLSDQGKYDKIKDKFKVFGGVEWLCGNDPFASLENEKIDNNKIGNSLKVSMFLYLTIFNIQYRNTHIKEILHPGNTNDLVLLLSILECFIKKLFDGVDWNQEGKLVWGSNSLDINTLKKAINSASVADEVKIQFNDLVTLTEIFFGATNVRLLNGMYIKASLIFQHPMKDSPELISLLLYILKNTDYHGQGQVHPGRGSTAKSTKLSVYYIFSLIYSPIFRLTVLFSKYLKTGSFNFLLTGIPAQIKKIGELNELLKKIYENPAVNGELQNEIKKLLEKYNIIENHWESSGKEQLPEGETAHLLSDWIVALDKLNESNLFHLHTRGLSGGGEESAHKDIELGGGKKNKELEKEIKKNSRNALKISKKKELIKEKIKKIDNKLKELDNKKKELGKIYKIKKNKVLKDKIDKTIKNINKEKVNKSDKKKEFKKTSNEYKKIDKELKKMDKALKKLKIKNKK